jgi:hypothetical protein
MTRAGVQIGARSSDNRAFGQGGSLLLVDELDIHLMAKDKFQRMHEGSYTTSTLTILTEQLVFHLI